MSALELAHYRQDFPTLSVKVHGRPLVYLDNAATTQKPRAVLDAIQHYYAFENANVHRGVHHLSQLATEHFERARQSVADFIGAEEAACCIFTRGATEGINLVAHSFVTPRLEAGDEILITAMEHHANIVPWQLACERVGAKLVPVPVNERGEVTLAAFKAHLTERTRFVAIIHVSNTLGTINDVAALTAAAQAWDIPVLVDGTQATPHQAVDVQAIGCDFYVFSGHKMYGPTGVGVLWGKRGHLDAMPPYQGGGEMIATVSFAASTYASLPTKFEAGTPNIAGVIGLSAAIDYLTAIGFEQITAYEHQLLNYATESLQALGGFEIVGTSDHKASVISLTHPHIHPHDIGTVLDSDGVAVRTGHHCTMPLMQFLGLPATTRASLCFYNTREDVDVLIAALRHVLEMFG